jgi:rubrerythrin
MEFASLQEVITFAVHQEELACQLYTDAAARTANLSARKMLLEIAAEEAVHRDDFTRIGISLPQQEPVDREASTPRKLHPNASYPEILRFAIETENSASSLYEAAAEMTEDPKIRRMLQVLSEVERGHKKRVEEIYEECLLTENGSALAALSREVVPG